MIKKYKKYVYIKKRRKSNVNKMVRRRLRQTSNVRSIYVLYPGGLKRKLKEIRVIITRNGKRSALNDTITRANEQHLT